uniref:Regucalcin n=1 Tax=Clastoptera arizonana TaxID=38151 RepID=A0A1B6BZ00_9HEMI
MEPIIEPIGDIVELGEGPIYDEESKNIYFVDIFQAAIQRYNTETKEHYTAKLASGGTVSLIVQVEGQKDRFLIGHNNNLELITWDGKSEVIDKTEIYARLESMKAKTRINDGKVDPAGRIWAGTMGPNVEGTLNDFVPEQGSLYMASRDRDVSKQLAKIGISNGLSWSLDCTKFYFIDSLKYKVDSYDYNHDTGELSNENTIFDFKTNNIEGLPDGMTMDFEGKLWVACYGGGQILRIDPDNGKLLRTIKLPALEITSACFGGPNYDQLYVTSARKLVTPDQSKKYPYAGSLFKITNLGVDGVPSFKIKL